MKYDLYNDNLIDICKTADEDGLKELAEQIREFLIEKVSKTGGHIASNLGIVELSIALMRVFDSPRDKIIYDVGHQSYVHKILTGRAKGFDTLRQYKGMSGFPKCRESEHDHYETGHSGTSVSAAYGMAVARDLAGEDYQVTAVIGDGSFTGGIVYEALNNIGANKTNINIILNDNGMSIAHNVGALHRYLNNIRASRKYDEAKVSVKSALDNVPFIGNTLARGIKGSKEYLKHSVLGEEGNLIESLGIKYYGPVDGHDIREMEKIIRSASEYEGPTLIHVMTKKGMGYEWAEKYPRKFHGIGAFDPETGEVLSKSGVSYSQVFGRTLTEMASDDDKIVAVVAAMARAGYKPFVAIYSSFLQRAYDFIIEDIALQGLHVVFCLDRAGLVGADGETHHGAFDLSYMSMIPGMTVLAPSDGTQLEEMIRFANGMDGPVAIRYPRGSSESEHLRLARFKGSNNRISEGSDVEILAVGAMLDEAIQAAEILKEHGLSAGVVNIAVVKPVDTSLGDLRSKLVVTVEDNVLSGGFGEAFTARYKDSAFDILNIGLPDSFVEHGDIKSLRRECGMDAASIAKKILEKLGN